VQAGRLCRRARMTQDETALKVERYRRALASVSDAEALALGPIIDALRRPFDEELGEYSDIVSRPFANEFANRLRLFHAQHDSGEVLTKKSFEFVFQAASRAAGKHAEVATSATHPGSDVIVDGVGFSLKTEAAATINSEQITISKLMESAWTKECSTASDFFAGLHRIMKHLHEYERILLLRVFGRLETSGSVRYDLVEIPKTVLLEIENAKIGDFERITRAKGTSLPIKIGGTTAFTVVFDGSDQKITIRHLRTRLCRRHASWTIAAQPATS
jgi:hypothetical protein